MILRMAGVSIPPQLMRGPNEPGYREREPIRRECKRGEAGSQSREGHKVRIHLDLASRAPGKKSLVSGAPSVYKTTV